MKAAEIPLPALRPAHVVVVHGWGLSSFATGYWCHRLAQSGLAPAPFSYWSLRRSLDDNVARLAVHVQALGTDRPVHLAGHSLGGIMIMQCLARHRFANLGRVVMVGTPFQGSATAQKLKTTRYGKLLLGKTLVQWNGVNPADLPPGLEVGTIAGTSPLGVGRLIALLETPHDGTVSLSETHVPFATDRMVMRVTHSEMLISAAVTQQIERFLTTGRFLHQ